MKDVVYAFTVLFGMIGLLGVLFTFVIFFTFIVIQLRDFIGEGRKGK